MSTSFRLPSCCSPLLDQRLAVAGGRRDGDLGPAEPMAGRAFRCRRSRRLRGQSSVSTAKRLTLADGIGLDQASLDIALEGGKVDVTRIEGACLGGRCSATPAHRQGAGRRGGERQPQPDGRGPGGLRRQRQVGQPAARSAARSSSPARATSPRSALSVAARERHARARRGEACARCGRAPSPSAADAALKADPDKLVAAAQAHARGRARRRPAAAPGHGQARDRRRAAQQSSRSPSTRPRAARKARPASTCEALDLRRRSGDSTRSRRRPADKPALPAVTVTYRGPIGCARRPGAAHRLRGARARAVGAPHGARRGGAGAAAQARRGAPPRGSRAPAPAVRADAACRCRSLLPGHRSRAPPPRAEPSSVAARKRVCLQPSSGFSPICRSGRVCWHRPWRRLAGEAQAWLTAS